MITSPSAGSPRRGRRHRPLAAAALLAVGLACVGFAPAGPNAGSSPLPQLRFAGDLTHSLPPATGTPPTAARPGPTALPAAHAGRHGGPTATPAPRSTPTPGSHGTGLVSASGTSLVLNGATWQFVGYDDYRLPSASPGHQCGGPLTNADVAASLDEIHLHSGATVVRTWFMQAYGGPGNWAQLDRVVADAAARGMKVIPVLSDQWASCEPWPAGQPRYRSLGWYQSGYRHADYGYTLAYRDYAAAVAAHFRGNPAIAFWQLVNEAEALDAAGATCEDAAANAALRSFADDVAGVVKASDPAHLVSLGTIGTGQCGTSSGNDFVNLHSGRIDICEYHDYFGPGGLPGDQWNGVAVRINQCHALHKPIFAGEVGLQASIAADGSSGGPVTDASLARRAADFSAKLHAQLGAGVVGFLVWQYATGARTDGFEVQPGDPTEAVMSQFAVTLPRGGT